MACIEDVLHMVIRALSQNSVLASFLEQVNLLGGCQIFVNLLSRFVLFLHMIIVANLLNISEIFSGCNEDIKKVLPRKKLS